MENRTNDSFGVVRNIIIEGTDSVISGDSLPEFDLRGAGIKAKEYNVTLLLRYGKLTLKSVGGSFKPPLFKKLPQFLGAEPEKAADGSTVYNLNKPSDFSGKITVMTGGKKSSILFSNGVMISQQFEK